MSTEQAAAPRPNRGRAAGPGNRRALIDAAREIYAAEGLSAPFSAIARRAGVGQGSLYRHFPDRIALAVAVFDANIGELETSVAGEDRTLDDLLDLVVAQAMTSTALIELVTAHLDDPRVAPLGGRFRTAVTGLLERDQRAGRIDAGIEIDDVEMAVRMLALELSRTPEPARPAVAGRARALFAAAFAPR